MDSFHIHAREMKTYSERTVSFSTNNAPLHRSKKLLQPGTKDTTLPTGAERILFVDDEEMILEMGRSMLERLGYAVTVMDSSKEAWNLFDKDPSYFDLVLTDHVMPDMTGLALAQEMLKKRKNLPIILCTGHSGTVGAEEAHKVGISAFLTKPVTKQELAETIREVLNGMMTTP